MGMPIGGKSSATVSEEDWKGMARFAKHSMKHEEEARTFKEKMRDAGYEPLGYHYAGPSFMCLSCGSLIPDEGRELHRKTCTQEKP